MVVEMDLTWDERRELRRQKRQKSLQAICRDVPDRAQIQERRLKSQQKTEERKKKKELLEASLQQEEKARLERQKKREEKRKSREFDPEYIERVNAAIMSRIKTQGLAF